MSLASTTQKPKWKPTALGPDGTPWRRKHNPALEVKNEPWRKAMAARPTRPDDPTKRPDLRRYVIKIISTHNRFPGKGLKRIQAVVCLFGITKTVHMDVPRDFTI